MNFTSSDMVLLGLLLVIATQTSYTTYKQWRQGSQSTSGARDILVDTSVLMDGRIVSVAETGFMPGGLVIPRSVVGELQFLADNSDSEKRERARRGLDVIKQLQAMPGVPVEILQDGSKASEGVDERLLTLAKKHGMKLCTIDFNLNKVAQVEAIDVLNINELARNLRMTYLPGDQLSLDLTTGGSDSHQAVGHLDDGTMVVVEQARSAIGSRQDVEIIRSLQTAAGKMMFAKLVNQSNQKSIPATASSRKKPANGRKAAAKPASKTEAATSKASHSDRPRTSSSKPRSASSSNKTADPRSSARTPNGRRKKTNEDRLIDLVDAQ